MCVCVCVCVSERGREGGREGGREEGREGGREVEEVKEKDEEVDEDSQCIIIIHLSFSLSPRPTQMAAVRRKEEQPPSLHKPPIHCKIIILDTS